MLMVTAPNTPLLHTNMFGAGFFELVDANNLRKF